MYIAEYSNHRIREVTVSTGIVTTIAGTGSSGYSGDGGAATSAALNSPNAVAIDLTGRYNWSTFLLHILLLSPLCR